MKRTLFDIEDEFRTLFDAIEEQDGEITPVQEAMLELNESDRDRKADAYANLITEEQGYLTTIDTEIARLTDLKRSRLSKVDRLKTALLRAVETFGKFDTGTHKFGLRRSEAVVLVRDDYNNDHMSKAYFRDGYDDIINISFSWNKKEMKKRLKRGYPNVPFANIEERKNLVIK